MKDNKQDKPIVVKSAIKFSLGDSITIDAAKDRLVVLDDIVLNQPTTVHADSRIIRLINDGDVVVIKGAKK